MRIWTVLKITAVLLVALVVTAVAVIYNIDFGAYKQEIAAAVKDATGRELVIEGEFRPRIGLTPAVAVERVRFANAPWGSRPHMATIESLRAEVELLPVLTGEIRIKQVVLVGADILLETKPDGGGNWVMGAPSAAEAPSAGGPATIPTVHLVSIEKSRLEWRDGRTGRSTVFKVDRLRVRADDAGAPLQINLRGAYDEAPVTLVGTMGSLVRVMSGTDSLPLDFTATAGGATLGVKGTIARPLEAKGVRIAVSAEGSDLAGFARLAGRPVPSIGPYRLAATLSDAEKGWALKEISANVGKSVLLGEAAVDPARKPPLVTARLTSPLLRLSDFQDAKASAKPAAAAAAGDGRVFSDAPLPLDALRAVDARVTFRATRIETPKAALGEVAVDLALEGGRLRVKPARLNIAGGVVATELTLDPTGDQPALAMKFDALRVDLAALLKDAGRPGLVTGKVDFGGEANGRGRSVRAIMAGLDGKLAVTMMDGRLKDEVLEFASADLLKLISPFGSREEGIGINCLVGRYDVRRGRLKSLAMLFDTTRASVRGTGGANLADESLDFMFDPHAKEASVMALMVPIRVGGTFAAPSVYPDPGGVAKSAVGVVAGVALGPVGLIGSVIGNVVGDDSAKPSSTAANNPCVAALSDKPPPAGAASPKTAPAGSGSGSLPEGVGRTLEGIGQGIDKGLKSLFGQ